MKWLVAIAFVVASASIVIPALIHIRQIARPAEQLDQIHELATF
ncbi:MAG TPA: hypothetical protein VGW96_00255 [Candidatus Eremiobacteraceae bacterium]|jgi:hypothetical protein|nr:hypothetical protein [Candidatus Eremiobacteraceae bacterium]